jgi:hypothetical protein
VFAVLEVKPTVSRQWLREAGEKAASVRTLQRTSAPVIAAGQRRASIRPRRILAGLLAAGSVWNAETYAWNVEAALADLEGDERIDLGCALEHGAFEWRRGKARVSTAEEALVFFVIRLLERLRGMGTAPAADLMRYARTLESFRRK